MEWGASLPGLPATSPQVPPGAWTPSSSRHRLSKGGSSSEPFMSGLGARGRGSWEEARPGSCRGPFMAFQLIHTVGEGDTTHTHTGHQTAGWTQGSARGGSALQTEGTLLATGPWVPATPQQGWRGSHRGNGVPGGLGGRGRLLGTQTGRRGQHSARPCAIYSRTCISGEARSGVYRELLPVTDN